MCLRSLFKLYVVILCMHMPNISLSRFQLYIFIYPLFTIKSDLGTAWLACIDYTLRWISSSFLKREANTEHRSAVTCNTTGIRWGLQIWLPLFSIMKYSKRKSQNFLYFSSRVRWSIFLPVYLIHTSAKGKVHGSTDQWLNVGLTNLLSCCHGFLCNWCRVFDETTIFIIKS